MLTTANQHTCAAAGALVDYEITVNQSTSAAAGALVNCEFKSKTNSAQVLQQVHW